MWELALSGLYQLLSDSALLVPSPHTCALFGAGAGLSGLTIRIFTCVCFTGVLVYTGALRSVPENEQL